MTGMGPTRSGGGSGHGGSEVANMVAFFAAVIAGGVDVSDKALLVWMDFDCLEK